MPPPSSSSTFTSRRYALVIDAGSSGSRMQIYSWKDPRAEREEVRASSSGTASDPKGKGRQQEDLSKLRRLPRVERGVKEGSGDWQKKVEPGLSTLALAPISHSAVSSYLSPLLAHAKASIPPSLHSSTPVYILATAGMRLLPPETSDALIQASCDVLRQEFPFRVENEGPEGPCGGSVRVISGEEEGLWGWVAVNYLMDGFGDPNALEPTTETVEEEDDPYFATSSSSSLSTAAPSTYGFLDMGGASTQIAFSPSPQEAASHRSSLSSVKLRLLSGEDMDFSVFVASWLGYGTNKARERYVGLKVEEWETSLRPSTSSSIPEPSIPDPCLPKSLLLSESPKIPHSHLATASSSSVNHLLSTHSLVGTGSFPECLKSLQPLLNKHLPCPSPHECLFDGLPTPKIDFEQQRFIGVSEYWYSSEHVFNMGGAWDFLEFERKAGEFCAREWGEIEKGYERSRKLGELPHSGDGEVLDADGRVVEMGKWGAEVEIPRLQMQCFKAAWLVNVLHEGIGLPRVVDPGGGHLSSSSSPLSKTDLEAARKAKQKGLGGPSFQSIDTVGDTAISWTLGKMVIEASRDVPPALPSSSYTDWVSLPDRLLGIDHLMEGRLDRLGGGSYFAYGFVLLGVLLLFFVKFRRRVFRVASPVRRVNRWKKDLEESDEYEEEESHLLDQQRSHPSVSLSLLRRLDRLLPFPSLVA
ncbi:nucleoside phosphatase family-domain-containing protein [Mrakia frigida]|uniref:apyrase n=1 Tax=Mrakia frigida TaxID=29902 RepID=UPI003FCC17D4